MESNNKQVITEIIAVGLFVLLALSIQVNSQSYIQENSICNVSKIENKGGFNPIVLYQLNNSKITECYDKEYVFLESCGIEFDKHFGGIIKIPINDGTVNITCQLRN